MDQTFLLSNIAPQVGEGFNRNYWAHTEDFVRKLTGKFDDVWVFTVPLYLPKMSGDGKMRVTYERVYSQDLLFSSSFPLSSHLRSIEADL